MIGRKTQICTLRASNEPHGLVVSINGPIDAALLSAIRDSLSAKDTTDELTVTTFAPPPATVVSPSHFQPPTDWFVGAELDGGDTALTQHRNDFAPPAGTTTRGGAVLQLQDGRRFALAPRMLLGRDPAPRDDADTGAILVVIADDAISKTHLAMGRQGDAVWVEDRRSTNGTMLLDGLGRQVSLASGQRSVFGLPMTIVIGDTTASISAKL